MSEPTESTVKYEHEPVYETANVLASREIVDDKGVVRPAYTIGDHEVVFRNRQDTVYLHDSHVQAIQGAGQEPLPVEHDGMIPNEEKNNATKAEYESYLESASTVPDAIVVTANTPEGILHTAGLLNPDIAKEYGELAGEMHTGKYSEAALELLDAITASIYVGDNGELLDTMLPNGKKGIDIAGFALVTAALAGDVQANNVVEARLRCFRDEIAKRNLGHAAASAVSHATWLERQPYAPEHLSADKVALVHSTKYPVSIDDDGAVRLKPSSQFREDKFPRATVHFTPNSQVTSHVAGTWAETNRLIVGNFQGMIDANGTPSSMNDVDTFFTLDPGKELVVPGAIVVEGSPNAVQLIEKTEHSVVYKAGENESYSDAEIQEIRILAQRTGVHIRTESSLESVVREVALRQTMHEQGVEYEMMTEAGAHYSDSPRFSAAYSQLAQELEVATSSLHIYTQQSAVEEIANGYIKGYESTPGASVGEDKFTSVSALRQVTASGYWPATNPPKRVEDSLVWV